MSPVSLPAVLARPSLALKVRMPFWLRGSLWDFLQSENPQCLAGKTLPSSFPSLLASLSGPAAREALLGLPVLPSWLGGQGCLGPCPIPGQPFPLHSSLEYCLAQTLPHQSHIWVTSPNEGRAAAQPGVVLCDPQADSNPHPLHNVDLVLAKAKTLQSWKGKSGSIYLIIPVTFLRLFSHHIPALGQCSNNQLDPFKVLEEKG